MKFFVAAYIVQKANKELKMLLFSSDSASRGKESHEEGNDNVLDQIKLPQEVAGKIKFHQYCEDDIEPNREKVSSTWRKSESHSLCDVKNCGGKSSDTCICWS